MGVWVDKVTENPDVGDTEVWEIYNATADAHPIHIHELTFEVVNRGSSPRRGGGEEEVVQPIQRRQHHAAGALETGFKDTVVALPGQVTRVRAQFPTLASCVALPHRRARRQRDDAAIPHRSATGRTAARP